MSEKILYCDSKGDKRFSALSAWVTFKDGSRMTIEKYYQASKRTVDGKTVGKGLPVHHVVIDEKVYPASILSELYNKLWEMYFRQNPELLIYACGFDKFVDRFGGKSINRQDKTIASIVGRYLKGTRNLEVEK